MCWPSGRRGDGLGIICASIVRFLDTVRHSQLFHAHHFAQDLRHRTGVQHLRRHGVFSSFIAVLFGHVAKADTGLGRTGRCGLSKGLTAVFVVHHEYQRDDDRDETKLIGIYSSEAKAKLAIERLRVLPAFSECPDGFSVDCYPIDADHWIQGLVQQ
jgi:hypothetical protein